MNKKKLLQLYNWAVSPETEFDNEVENEIKILNFSTKTKAAINLFNSRGYEMKIFIKKKRAVDLLNELCWLWLCFACLRHWLQANSFVILNIHNATLVLSRWNLRQLRIINLRVERQWSPISKPSAWFSATASTVCMLQLLSPWSRITIKR